MGRTSTEREESAKKALDFVEEILTNGDRDPNSEIHRALRSYDFWLKLNQLLSIDADGRVRLGPTVLKSRRRVVSLLASKYTQQQISKMLAVEDDVVSYDMKRSLAEKRLKNGKKQHTPT